jgi:uncharacterized protein YegL
MEKRGLSFLFITIFGLLLFSIFVVMPTSGQDASSVLMEESPVIYLVYLILVIFIIFLLIIAYKKLVTKSRIDSLPDQVSVQHLPSNYQCKNSVMGIHDVFISYSSEDKSIADAVCTGLESHFIRCWIAPRDILPGEDFPKQIIDAINYCKVFVLIFSSHSNVSPHVTREVTNAVGKGIIIIPFRIENVPTTESMEYLIGFPHWIDAIEPSLGKPIETLARRINSVSRISLIENKKNTVSQSVDRDSKKIGSSESEKNLYENAQFTVFRPSAIMPEKWYSLLFFAHLAERPDNAKEDEPDPLAEVERQAGEILQDTLEQYSQLRQDSSQSLPKEGQLTIKLYIEGIVCNPSERIFSWYEPVHREIFRIKTNRDYINTICRGRISVYFGSICVAEIQCPIKVTDSPPINKITFNRTSTRRYRKIFTSYSRKDEKVVMACENFARATGDEFLRDVVSIHNGEIWNERLLDLIREADIFQLFWSNKSMYSPFVQQEWEYALTLNRPNFIRPVYWEDPFPEDTEKKLPPQELQQFQFHKLGDIVMNFSDRQDTKVQVNRDHVSPSSHINSIEAGAATPDDQYSVSGFAEENPKVLDLENLKNVSMNCPNCNYVNPRNWKFCKKCGYSLMSSPPQQSLPQTQVQVTTYNSCSACGEVNPLTSKFCRNCGSPMKKPIPSSLSPSYPVTSDIQIGGSAKDLLSQIEVASPEKPHYIILLLLDTSGSMIENRKIDQLNEGIRLIKEEILRDESASSRVDIAVVTFGDGVVKVVHPFTSIRDFQPPFLSANGNTPLGEAILIGIDLIETRKKIYRNLGLNYFRPLIFAITDGEPTDMTIRDRRWSNVKSLIENCEKSEKLRVYLVGVEPANMDLLSDLMPSEWKAVRLRQGKFPQMFQWLSDNLMTIVTQDLNPGEIGKPNEFNEWGELFFKNHDLIFLSAKSEDFHSAQQVYSLLKKNGYNVFFSDQTLPHMGKSDYRREIDRALDLAKHMVVVTSRKEYVESKWVEAEWGSFINEKRSGRKQGNIITLITGSMCIEDLPGSLRYYEVLPLEHALLDKILRYLN